MIEFRILGDGTYSVFLWAKPLSILWNFSFTNFKNRMLPLKEKSLLFLPSLYLCACPLSHLKRGPNSKRNDSLPFFGPNLPILMFLHLVFHYISDKMFFSFLSFFLQERFSLEVSMYVCTYTHCRSSDCYFSLSSC